MRQILILGGTAWLGREIATVATAAGVLVTCLARGSSGEPPPGATLVCADRTQPDAYTAVEEQSWDEVVELSYDPALVTGALEALAHRAKHWTLVSSVSVYASNSDPGADETAALVGARDLEDYAQAKVAAEQVTFEVLGDRALIVRPGLIAGPGDGSDRFGYWVSRFALAHHGPVLTPEPRGRSAQVIDVADLAAWIVEAGRRRLSGPFNVVGDPHPLADALDLAADVAGFAGEMIPVKDDWLLENDVRYWAGPRSLPLWLPVADAALAERSNAAFKAAGGTLTNLRGTLIRVLDDERARGLDRDRRSGLTRAEELDLLVTL